MATEFETTPDAGAESRESFQVLDEREASSPPPAKRRRDDLTSQAQDPGLNYDEPERERAAKRSRGENRDRRRRDSREDEAPRRRYVDADESYSDRERFSPRRRPRDGGFERDFRFTSGRDLQDRDYRGGRAPFDKRRFSGHGPEADTREDRLKTGVSQEERKRGKRLFGGLLSTLSQTSGRSPLLQRRQETAHRQPDGGQRGTAEDDRRRAKRMEKLAMKRKIEQVKFDEQVMDSRHANLLALAENLQTRSLPRLYYRPYELTREQERTIEEQVRVAEETIEREKEAFAREKKSRLAALGVRPARSQISPGDAAESDGMEADNKDDKAEAQRAGAEETSDADAIKVDSTMTAPPAKEGEKQGEDQKDSHDDHKHRHDHDERDRDIMVETEEDTVIY